MRFRMNNISSHLTEHIPGPVNSGDDQRQLRQQEFCCSQMSPSSNCIQHNIQNSDRIKIIIRFLFLLKFCEN